MLTSGYQLPSGPAGGVSEIFSFKCVVPAFYFFVRQFSFIMDIFILFLTLNPQACRNFLLETGFCNIQVLFNTGFTVFKNTYFCLAHYDFFPAQQNARDFSFDPSKKKLAHF
jgi:hypothetical protein